MSLRAWLTAARARRNVQRAVRPLGSADALIDRYAPGRSFVDVGAIWVVHGRTAFLAEAAGASAVTAVDLSPETDEYLREHERRSSSVRFVQGDLHDAEARKRIGPHDVVWCSGVLYHCPNPVHSLECLRELTAGVLVLQTASVPEIPGIRQAGVFWPTLPERDRLRYDAAYHAISKSPARAERAGLTTPFDPERTYANWWWGLTPSSIEGMLEATGFKVEETKSNGFHTRIVASAA